ASAGERAWRPGRLGGDTGGGDRGGTAVSAAARNPLGSPPAAADPRDPDPGAHGVRMTTTQERPVRDEIRRIARDTGYAWRLARGRVELPPATPPDDSDPYGDPDPEWLRIDWHQHLRRVYVVGAQTNYVEMGDGPPLLFVHGLSGCWQ